MLALRWRYSRLADPALGGFVQLGPTRESHRHLLAPRTLHHGYLQPRRPPRRATKAAEQGSLGWAAVRARDWAPSRAGRSLGRPSRTRSGIAVDFWKKGKKGKGGREGASRPASRLGHEGRHEQRRDWTTSHWAMLLLAGAMQPTSVRSLVWCCCCWTVALHRRCAGGGAVVQRAAYCTVLSPSCAVQVACARCRLGWSPATRELAMTLERETPAHSGLTVDAFLLASPSRRSPLLAAFSRRTLRPVGKPRRLDGARQAVLGLAASQDQPKYRADSPLRSPTYKRVSEVLALLRGHHHLHYCSTTSSFASSSSFSVKPPPFPVDSSRTPAVQSNGMAIRNIYIQLLALARFSR